MAKNDSANATAGVGKRNNNPGNMRCIGSLFLPDSATCKGTTNNNGVFQSFSSLEDGIRHNVALYVRKYAGKSPDDITRIWAGNPQSKGYWRDIRACFPS